MWAIMFEAILQQSVTLLILAGLVLITICLGWFIISRINITFTSMGEQIFFSTGIGLAILGYLIFILGIFHLLYPIVLYSLLAFLSCLSISGLFNLRNASLPQTQSIPRPPLDKIAAIITIVFLFIGLLLTLTPEIGKDALIYHLTVPKLMLKQHGFYFIPGNIFSNYPLHSEMVFLLGLFLNGDTLAKGIHFSVLLCILLGIRQFTIYRIKGNTFPAISMMVFITIPSVFLTSHMAYNDLFVTFYSMAAVFAFINWYNHNERAWLILCGVFSGLAIACKYTALILPPLGCLGILWFSRHQRLPLHKASRYMFFYMLFVFITGSPFYIKNWIITGNPVYPFFYSIFGGKGWEPDQARLYDFFVQNLGAGRTFLDYILLPWNLSFNAKMDSPQFDGLLGPIFFLILPFVIGIRKLELPLKIIIVYCAFTFLFWAGSAQQVRYIIPVFPFLAILVGSVLTYYQKRKLLFSILLIFLTAGLTFNGYYIIRDFLKIRPIHVLIGLESKDAFLSRSLPSYDMFQFANKHLPRDSKIFLIYMKNWGFLCDKDCYSDSMFESYTIQKILSNAATPEVVSRELRAQAFTHILYDINYIYGPLSIFSSEEKALFFSFQNKYLVLVKTHGPFYLYSIK